jgi:putative Mg2+ transporter-C (MgtC) family protein
MPDMEMLIRLVTAAALGSLIGFERERLLWARGSGPTCWYVSAPA